jgi:hypothetical protein
MSATDVPTGRALHLVDLENVLGDPWAVGPCVAATYEEVLVRGLHREGDLVVVAVNPGLAKHFAFTDHTSCQLLIGRGRDGADLALLGWGTPEFIARRFDRLVVASGDGIFAGIVRALRELDVRVEVLYGNGRVSGRLHRNGVPLVRVPVADDHDLAA